jgi:hypothetical protein
VAKGKSTAKQVLATSAREKHGSLSTYIILIITFLYTLGVKRFYVPSGLDQTYQWIVSKSVEDGDIFRGEFLGTYGPLGFLDFNFSNAVPFRVISLLISDLIFSSFIFAMAQHIRDKQIVKTKAVGFLLAFFILLVVERFTSPSLLLIYVLILKFREITSQRKFWLVSVLSAVMFYIKLFPFSLMMIFLFYIVNHGSGNPLRSKRGIARNLKFISIPILAIIAPLFTANSRTWLRGYWETLVGYSAMAGKPPDPYYSMTLFVLLSFAICYFVLNLKTERYLFALVSIVFFNYGFVRQDVSHFSSAFFVLLLWCLAAPRPANALKQRMTSIRFRILVSVSILALAIPSAGLGLRWTDIILLYFLSSFVLFSQPQSRAMQVPIFLTAILYVLVTTQSPTQIAKGLFSDIPYIGSKSIKVRLNDAQVSFQQTFLGHSFVEVPDSATEVLARSFGSERLLVISNNDVYRSSTFFGAKNLPVPMLFGTFTPWLDKQNVDYLVKNRFDKIFFQHDTPIDGNSWVSEAPATALYIFCNYVPDSKSDSWLLLKVLPKSRCSPSALNSKNSVDNNDLILMDIKSSSRFPGEEIFTDRGSYLDFPDGKRFGFQPRNSKGLIARVPLSLDYPYPWNLNILRTGKSTSEITYYALPLT